MTIAELYEMIGGNYDHAIQIMRKDKMISKYILKLESSGVYENLMEAGESMDAAGLFESAHAMKGVCGNLGLDDLAEAAERITEEFRPGSERKYTDEEVKELIAKVDELYTKTAEGIKQYEASRQEN
jgi:HPt (histidine-containing phosphotransfer) domain-containing protein